MLNACCIYAAGIIHKQLIAKALRDHAHASGTDKTTGKRGEWT